MEGQQLQSQLKILFIDDHSGLRDSLSFLLEKKNPLFKFYLASDLDRAELYLKSNPEISIAIVDLNLNGEDGLVLIDPLRQIKAELKIIIYTMYNDPIHIKNSLQKDIQGFITKDLDAAEIERAILCVNDGNLFYCKEAKAILHELIQSKAVAGGGFYSGEEGERNTEVIFKNYQMLTQKEQEVFALLAQKKDVDEVADLLNKSVKTIQNKKSLIYQKMNVKDRLELVEAAKLLGVII